MFTALPVDVWERIVEQLPPSQPKLVPMVWFAPRGGQLRVYASKAVSETEVKYIMNTDDLNTKCVDINDVYWACTTNGNGDAMDTYIRCKMLGWDFERECDRNMHFVPTVNSAPFWLVRK
jgi:hypothetical protein